MEFYSGEPENPAASVVGYCTGVLIGPYDRFGNKKSSYAKPSSYGKPGSSNPKYGGSVSSRSKYPKGSSGGKYGSGRYGPMQVVDRGGENPHGTREAIARARVAAVEWAERYMHRYSAYSNGHEFGCYVTYNTETGDPEEYNRYRAGNGSGSHYRFSYRPSQGLLLVTGHSHPRETPSRSTGTNEDNNDLNTIESEGDLNTDDANLLDHAPVVIKQPSNRSIPPIVLWGTWRGR